MKDQAMKKLNRRDAVARLLENRKDALVVTGLGSSSYDVMAAGDHDNNYYLWGAMGGAAMVGLGLALSQPKRTVIVITGDGEQLMGMGGFATIGVAKPNNLILVVLNNEHYGETGMQRSHVGHGVDLVTVAQACSLENCLRITDTDGIDQLTETMHQHNGSSYAEIIIDSGEATRILPPRDAVYIKNRFMSSLGFATI